MASAGELLREERLKRNRSLSDIATETCICSRYLSAIEDGNPGILPGDFFHRSFIKAYAQALSLDEATTKHILSLAERIDDSDPLPVLTAVDKTARTERRLSGLNTPRLASVLTLLFAALTCASGLYAVWHEKQVQQELATAPAAYGPISVVVSAVETTWLSVSSDGRTLFEGELAAAETKSFELTDGAKLLTQNAAGVQVSVNGKSIGRIGSRGQSRVVMFSPRAFEILPALSRAL